MKELQLNIFKQEYIPVKPEKQQQFTKPAQLTSVRDILSRYSRGEIIPTLKTLPSDEGEIDHRPNYENQHDMLERQRAFDMRLAQEARQRAFDMRLAQEARQRAETAQKSTESNETVQTSTESVQSAPNPSNEA